MPEKTILARLRHLLPSTLTSPSHQPEDEELKVGAATIEHPMFVASHGGGGHMSAIKALIATHKQSTGYEVETPRLPAAANWRAKKLRELGSMAANTALLGTILKKYDIVPDM